MPTERCTLWVERRTPAGWVGVENLDGSRWYVGRDLFQVVAGPIPGGPPWWPDPVGRPAGLGPPRGLPVDVSAAVLSASEVAGEWAFCHSWATLAELETFAIRHPEYAAGESLRLDWVLTNMRACGAPADVRAVVWYQDRG